MGAFSFITDLLGRKRKKSSPAGIVLGHDTPGLHEVFDIEDSKVRRHLVLSSYAGSGLRDSHRAAALPRLALSNLEHLETE
ncbi:hypothetical protein [Burkholderia ubonensis]|uniref:hypothetical protein n=1 Tax=Burkholderia ubonensis TaxID=101571 RepID=UPI0012F8BB95|nr:hypothetical protein [Burkholderia ubonensis]